MIDLHCHLDLYEKPSDVADQCIQRGIYVLSVTTTPSAWEETTRIARNAQRIRTALGLHPELAAARRHELDLFEQILSETHYVGEIGLDGSKQLRLQWAVQVEVFERILAMCERAGGKIMSIHSRGATGEVLDLLERFCGAGTPILHWFSGSTSELRRAVDLGCWFSVGPTMLCGKKGQSLVNGMPRDRVVTETDGPFVRFDNRPAYPWDVCVVEERLGKLWGVPSDELVQILLANFKALLGGQVQT